MATENQPAPVLQIKHVSKRFDTTQALDDVSLTLYPGESPRAARREWRRQIHADQDHDRRTPAPTTGELLLDGQAGPRCSSSQVRRSANGVAAIYQEPMVFPDLSTWRRTSSSRHRPTAACHRQLGARCNQEAASDPRASSTCAWTWAHAGARPDAGGAQQAVEIAKAISLQRARADHGRADRLAFGARSRSNCSCMARIRCANRACRRALFIGHRLEEVFAQSPTASRCCRDGKSISPPDRGADVTSRAGLIRDMVGREVERFLCASRRRQRGGLLMSARGSRQGRLAFHRRQLRHLQAGEVLGFAGLVGARRTDVGLALFGVEPADERGDHRSTGKPVRDQDAGARHALAAGIAYVTEDRRALRLDACRCPSQPTSPCLRCAAI
jgi:rhamnose transport system ATP-binding protein